MWPDAASSQSGGRGREVPHTGGSGSILKDMGASGRGMEEVALRRGGLPKGQPCRDLEIAEEIMDHQQSREKSKVVAAEVEVCDEQKSHGA